MLHWPEVLQGALGEFARGVSTALAVAAAGRPDGGACPACPPLPPTACHCQSVCPSQASGWLLIVAIAAAIGIYIGFRAREFYEQKESDSSPSSPARPARRALAGGTWLGHGGAFSGRAGTAASDRD